MSAKNVHLRLSAVKSLELENYICMKLTKRPAYFRGTTTEEERAEGLRKLIESHGAASRVVGLGAVKGGAKRTWTYSDVWSHLYGKPWPTPDLFTTESP